MSVIAEVLEELWSMFVGDRRLTLLLLAVVGLAAVVAYVVLQPLLAAGIVLTGAVAVLADSVFEAARKSRPKA
ncbi:MAG TPA: hypothetical protein VMT68_03095 [Caulobacteraceae bacterium]|nr:hypothetical protein [Caulobacteraceae bacterium]